MKLIKIFAIALISITSSIMADEWDDYTRLLRNMGSMTNEQYPQQQVELDSFKRNAFSCDISAKFPKATSVHALRPNDIEVVGAIGDSLSAANGARAWTVIGVLDEYRGVSWSIGGEKTSIKDLVTIPNIIRQYNPNVHGFSTATVKVDHANSFFNLAHPGDTAVELPQQAKDLTARIRASSKVDFQNSWKLVTLFIGGNDLCKSCKDPAKYSINNFINNMNTTLSYLRQNLPKTFVNVVLSIDVSGIDILTGITCRTLQNYLCSCGLDSSYRSKLKALTVDMQNKVESMINSGMYDTDTFAVVAQPFMKLMTPPTKSDGKADYSYFAPDCFHLSAKGHQAMAVELWNNMFVKVGQKALKWSHLEKPIACPNAAAPFFFTNKNSKMSLKELIATNIY